MEKDLVIAIDYGTQSVRVSIIDKDGNFLAFEQEKYDKPYFSVKPGFCEQYPDYYYEKMVECAKRVTSKHKDLLERCASVSSTCFRDSVAFLDKNYKPIRPSIIWLDQRNAKGTKKLPLLYRAVYALIGMSDTINMNRRRTPAMWLQENEAELYKLIRWYAPINCYFNYKMTGVLGDSGSNMIGHFPIAFKTMKLHHRLNPIGIVYGIDPKLIPSIFKSGVVLGHISKECEEETGLPEGLPYITTGGDKNCETLGSGCVDKYTAHISYGTASNVCTMTKKYFSPETFLPSYGAPIDGYYNAEVQIYRGYWMLRWFSHEFAQEESMEANIENLAVEEVLNKKLMEIEPGCDGLVLSPYWGAGLKRPLAKGAILGFYDTHSKYHIYRAIIEGIAYGLKEGMISIEKHSHYKFKELTVAGGGSKSDAICQITSDIFDMPVKVPETYETSSLGCAMAQFVALGIYKDAVDAKDHMVKYTKVFIPNPEAAEKYKFLYNKVYKDIYPSLKKVNKNLFEYQAKYVQNMKK